MEGISLHYFTPIASNIIRYFMVAGTAFVIFYKFYPNKFFKNKIQLGLAKNKDFIFSAIEFCDWTGDCFVFIYPTP